MSHAPAPILSDRDEAILQDIAPFWCDPLAYVLYIFPWGTRFLSDSPGPDEWQARVLRKLGEQIASGESPRIAISAGNGPGKTALLAWIVHWFISTHTFPQITVTAGTQTQLNLRTWRELAKWNTLALNGHWYDHTATKFINRQHPDLWFAGAVPWNANNPDAFAGMHERNVLLVFDEASAVDDIIWRTASGAMTTPGAIWVVAGNPTRHEGEFYSCFHETAHRWDLFRVDSREARMADRRQLQEWIDDYGIDSDFVRVHVLGEFPRATTTQLIGFDLVRRALEYSSLGWEYQPRIIGLDVARFGLDKTVFTLRQGRKVHWLKKFSEKDTMEVSDIAVDHINTEFPDALVIDETGVGAGVVDRLRQLGYGNKVFPYNGSGKPDDPVRYANKRCETWCRLRDSLKEGLSIPSDEDLKGDLTINEYRFQKNGSMILTSKDELRRRGIRSPDCGDSLAMTFAVQPASGRRRVPELRGGSTLGPQGWLRS